VKLQVRIDRWTSRGLAWFLRKLLSKVFGDVAPVSGTRRGAARKAIPLYRDPFCGTHISPEISFPLEQAGQVLHFCSAECRARYVQSSRRAASA